jgi:hypothetical protein
MHGTSDYPWQRFWVPHGEAPVMDGGYFVEPTTRELSLFPLASNGVPLASLKDVPCLILLGDVGMGKTKTAEHEAKDLRMILASQNHAVVLRNLHRVHFSKIAGQVLGDPEVQRWVRGDRPLTLFLDSLDECWRRVDELESILVAELEPHVKADRPPLYLRLLCRSAGVAGRNRKGSSRALCTIGQSRRGR